MKLILRLMPTLAGAFWSGPLTPYECSVRRYHVLPHDLDLNFHLNNGRYLQFMDLGRIDWLWRTGILQECLGRGWMMVLGGAMVRFRRPIGLFQTFDVTTRLVCWTDRAFILEHEMRKADGEVLATAAVQAAVLKRDGTVPCREVGVAIGEHASSPPMPAHIAAWLSAEQGRVDDRVGYVLPAPGRQPDMADHAVV